MEDNPLFKMALLCCSWLMCFGANAQTLTGISANIGNKVSYSAPSGFERPASLSGTLILIVQRKLKNNFTIQYGGGLGVLGYKLKIVSMDTLSTPDFFLFQEYSTYYGNLNALISKEISIKGKKVLVGLGGGATCYYSVFQNKTYAIDIALPDNSVRRTFYADTYCPDTRILPFAKISTQLELNRHFMFGLEYSYYFGSVMDGMYRFYHTRTPSAGTISLYQRELHIVFLMRISGIAPRPIRPRP